MFRRLSGLTLTALLACGVYVSVDAQESASSGIAGAGNTARTGRGVADRRAACQCRAWQTSLPLVDEAAALRLSERCDTIAARKDMPETASLKAFWQ